jgi:hypothetical protein
MSHSQTAFATHIHDHIRRSRGMSAFYIERSNIPGPGSANAGSEPGQGGQSGGAPSMPQSGMTGGMNGSQMSGSRNDVDQSQGANAGGTDYRDDLRALLDKAHAERGLTRYRLCKQMGIDSGTLSNVLAKRRHFSLEKLEQILGLLGYRLSFTPEEGGGMAIS